MLAARKRWLYYEIEFAIGGLSARITRQLSLLACPSGQAGKAGLPTGLAAEGLPQAEAFAQGGLAKGKGGKGWKNKEDYAAASLTISSSEPLSKRWLAISKTFLVMFCSNK